MKAAVERISVKVVVPKKITGASIFQAIKNATHESPLNIEVATSSGNSF
jgi:hypothetical protein